MCQKVGNIELSTLRPGDIIFTFNRKNVISYLIWRFSSSFIRTIHPKISHCAIYLGEGLILEAIPKGVDIYEICKYKNHDVKVKRHRGFNEKHIGKLYREVCNHIGKKYSYIQIVLFVLKRILFLRYMPDYSKEEKICSELVAEVFKSIGLFKIRDSSNVSPFEIYRRIDLTDV